MIDTNFEALFTRTDTEIQPVKVLHCVNGDGLKIGLNGSGTHLA